MENEVLIKYIIRQITNGVVYRAKNQALTISFRSMTGSMRQEILAEGHKWGLTDMAIDNLINDVRNNADHYRHATMQTVTALNVCKDLHEGNIVCLTGRSDTFGSGSLKLLFLGQSNVHLQPRFMVLESDRLALQPEDILCLCCSSVFNVTNRAAFSVFRGGRRVPDVHHLYVTDKLESISVQRPSLIHEVISSKRSFTFSEEMAYRQLKDGGEALTFGKNPMSFLLHAYSRLMPVYADFKDDDKGSFASNSNVAIAPSKLRDLIFSIPEDKAAQVLDIETTAQGMLQILPDTLRPVCLIPAQTHTYVSKHQES